MFSQDGLSYCCFGYAKNGTCLGLEGAFQYTSGVVISGAGVLNVSANSSILTSVSTATSSLTTVTSSQASPTTTTARITSAVPPGQPASTDTACTITNSAENHDVKIGLGVGLPLGLALLMALFLLFWERRKNRRLQGERHQIIQNSRQAASIIPSLKVKKSDEDSHHPANSLPGAKIFNERRFDEPGTFQPPIRSQVPVRAIHEAVGDQPEIRELSGGRRAFRMTT